MNILTVYRRQSVYERDLVKSMFDQYGMNGETNNATTKAPNIVNKIKRSYGRKTHSPKHALFTAHDKDDNQSSPVRDEEENKKVHSTNVWARTDEKINDQEKTTSPSEEEDNSMDFEITQPSNVTSPSSQTNDDENPKLSKNVTGPNDTRY